MKTHTPIPWTGRGKHGPCFQGHAIYGDGKWVASACDDQDVDFLCRAVNNHENLVTTIDELLAMLEMVMQRQCDEKPLSIDDCGNIEAAVYNAQAALKRATT